MDPTNQAMNGNISATMSKHARVVEPMILNAKRPIPTSRKSGLRKKTLSLNPEEREALENLVEEVIRDGGFGNEESSDEEEGGGGSTNSSMGGMNHASSEGGDAASKPKINKKYYPGQLKVALKHMTDLPPRFSRKLKKADKYLEVNALKQAADTVIPEEDEDEVAAASRGGGVGEDRGATRPGGGAMEQREKEKTKIKESTTKESKIKVLLNNLDQYVDEKTVGVIVDESTPPPQQQPTDVVEDVNFTKSDRGGAQSHQSSGHRPGSISCEDLEREMFTPKAASLSPTAARGAANTPAVSPQSNLVMGNQNRTRDEPATIKKERANKSSVTVRFEDEPSTTQVVPSINARQNQNHRNVSFQATSAVEFSPKNNKSSGDYSTVLPSAQIQQQLFTSLPPPGLYSPQQQQQQQQPQQQQHIVQMSRSDPYQRQDLDLLNGYSLCLPQSMHPGATANDSGAGSNGMLDVSQQWQNVVPSMFQGSVGVGGHTSLQMVNPSFSHPPPPLPPSYVSQGLLAHHHQQPPPPVFSSVHKSLQPVNSNYPMSVSNVSMLQPPPTSAQSYAFPTGHVAFPPPIHTSLAQGGFPQYVGQFNFPPPNLFSTPPPTMQFQTDAATMFGAMVAPPGVCFDPPPSVYAENSNQGNRMIVNNFGEGASQTGNLNEAGRVGSNGGNQNTPARGTEYGSPSLAQATARKSAIKLGGREKDAALNKVERSADTRNVVRFSTSSVPGSAEYLRTLRFNERRAPHSRRESRVSYSERHTGVAQRSLKTDNVPTGGVKESKQINLPSAVRVHRPPNATRPLRAAPRKTAFCRDSSEDGGQESEEDEGWSTDDYDRATAASAKVTAGSSGSLTQSVLLEEQEGTVGDASSGIEVVRRKAGEEVSLAVNVGERASSVLERENKVTNNRTESDVELARRDEASKHSREGSSETIPSVGFKDNYSVEISLSSVPRADSNNRKSNSSIDRSEVSGFVASGELPTTNGCDEGIEESKEGGERNVVVNFERSPMGEDPEENMCEINLHKSLNSSAGIKSSSSNILISAANCSTNLTNAGNPPTGSSADIDLANYEAAGDEEAVEVLLGVEFAAKLERMFGGGGCGGTPSGTIHTDNCHVRLPRKLLRQIYLSSKTIPRRHEVINGKAELVLPEDNNQSLPSEKDGVTSEPEDLSLSLKSKVDFDEQERENTESEPCS